MINSGVLARILLSILIITALIAFVGGQFSEKPSNAAGYSVLSNYLDDENGIALYNEDEKGIHKEKNLNLGKFYNDVLKVGGNADVIKMCSEEENYQECINEHIISSPKNKLRYETHKKSVNKAIDIGKEHGIDYLSVPFVRDFVEG